MKPQKTFTGVGLALLAAALFGASIPLAKILLGQVHPVLLAGLLYGGSGLGLLLWLLGQRYVGIPAAAHSPLTSKDYPWLGGAILAGGIIAPVLLMIGLTSTAGTTAALLLNLEGVFTATLAWWVFKENADARIIWGMVAITAGGGLLSWAGPLEGANVGGALAIIGACFAWGVDNNLTRNISTGSPVQIAAIKGTVAGMVNCSLGLLLGAPLPTFLEGLLAAGVGLLGYGLSLTFFITALEKLGTARTGAYFATAPFVGAALAIVLLRDPITFNFLGAAALMGLGVWLHLTENHDHEHDHEELEHDHLHSHDEHHQHSHEGIAVAASHSHSHRHSTLIHRHPHYPDSHHRHRH